MHRSLLFLAALALACPVQAADVAVRTAREGDTLRVEASADFDAEPRLAWRVLTDYERLAQFIPGIVESRIVGHGELGPVVEQRGEARLLFFAYSLQVRLAVEEYPYDRVVAHAVSGSFKRLDGVYSLQPAAGRTRLTYAGVLVPDFFVPPLIGMLVLRLNVERQFGALVDEIVRRTAPATSGAAPAP